MREGFGRTAYRHRKAAKAMAVLFAFAFFAVLCSSRCKAAPVDAAAGMRNETVLRDSNNTTYIEELTPTQAADGSTAEGENAEPTPTPKPKKQLAAEQYALGVILAGGIALGMMVALFFYYTKQNNIHRD